MPPATTFQCFLLCLITAISFTCHAGFLVSGDSQTGRIDCPAAPPHSVMDSLLSSNLSSFATGSGFCTISWSPRLDDLSLTTSGSICGLAGADHVERHVLAQEQLVVSLASSEFSSTRLVSHGSNYGCADTDYVERVIPAKEQIVVSLASSNISSTCLVSHNRVQGPCDSKLVQSPRDYKIEQSPCDYKSVESPSDYKLVQSPCDSKPVAQHC
ncbi:hypothetical protein C8J56DRAFT_961531 [Mycena floridula]|nr:hypothetical protein C8J56DRAFT_961531 [Mycena floridula]